MNALTSAALVARSPRKPIWEREKADRLDAVRKGNCCPGCGETENIQDNGEKRADRTWRCEKCGDQWDRFFGTEG